MRGIVVRSCHRGMGSCCCCISSRRAVLAWPASHRGRLCLPLTLMPGPSPGSFAKPHGSHTHKHTQALIAPFPTLHPSLGAAVCLAARQLAADLPVCQYEGGWETDRRRGTRGREKAARRNGGLSDGWTGRRTDR